MSALHHDPSRVEVMNGSSALPSIDGNAFDQAPHRESPIVQLAPSPQPNRGPDSALKKHPWTERHFVEAKTTTKPNETASDQINYLDRTEIERLNSRISTRMTSDTTIHDSSGIESDDTEPDDPAINPNSEEFNLKKWLQFVMRQIDTTRLKRRHTGITFRNLNVFGSDTALKLQGTVGTTFLEPLLWVRKTLRRSRTPHTHILRDCCGFLKEGEMLLVLGRPGSGCSTFLKAIAGRLDGLDVGAEAEIQYNGIPATLMHKRFKGETLYNQEVDKHFPHLTVNETLSFAAEARAPRNIPQSKSEYVAYVREIVMAVFKLRQAANTKIGDDFVRGVSGGERKRVSIAEAALSRAPFACWDNSTRGLDSASALEFTACLRTAADMTSASSAVAIYQASQAIYDLFDRVMVLFKGRQVYFGPRSRAKAFFEEMGYVCPERQTTGDFLTSVTNPRERHIRNGFDAKVPRTPDEFEAYWQGSADFKTLMGQIQQQELQAASSDDNALSQFTRSRKEEKAKAMRNDSPYTLNFAQQSLLCTRRAFQILWNDKSSTLATVIGTVTMALIIASIFYGTPQSTGSLFQKGGVLFFAILINALNAVSEINTLYAKRPIIEKHASYAFYHPSAEAIAGVIADIPVKFAVAVCFNSILYFLGGLRKEPGPFFIFFLFSFVVNFTMSFVFKTLGAVTKSVSQAMTLAGCLVLAIIIYTGFTIPRPYMEVFLRWISWINPVAYAFEALLVNELHDQSYACSSFVPSYTNFGGSTFVCAARGAIAGQTSVSGDAFLSSSYQYSYSHLWRNLGFLFAFLVFFLAIYLITCELNAAADNSAEVLVYRKGRVPAAVLGATEPAKDVENQHAEKSGPASTRDQSEAMASVTTQHDMFTWKYLNYDIKIKGQPRRLLDGVSGWVKPGTLTALMGSSGAGKTTLLDVLAQRVSTGVVTGDMLINGQPLPRGFQRSTGYVQQQDLHLETSTVREALRFSALLRQPASTSQQEKFDYVEQVIQMLDMTEFAEAIVGVPGEGLNVEQRKLLTIGVELAAKPALLIFLDEPTSGLDSQSAWAIVSFLRRLANHGQAVLCTIHQPSAILFQEFDRLLFLAKGGKTVYFGEIGKNSEKLTKYFQEKGARPCGPAENPAEWMLDILNKRDDQEILHDWPQIWRESSDYEEVQRELKIIKSTSKEGGQADGNDSISTEFAMPLLHQIFQTTVRVFQQYWRMPEYIYAKLSLGLLSSLFIGFSFFKANATQQGLQNVMFSIYMLTSIFTTLVQQIIPRFVVQRSLYEVRERPSKAYSWKAFIIANILVEIPWQILLSVVVFVCWYYPIGFWQYADPQFNERGGLMFFYILEFFLFASTFAQMVIAALPNAVTAGSIATVMFSLSLTFNGVIQTASALPGFWIFMYRVSPLTYLLSGMLSSGLHDRPASCASNELSVFDPPHGQTCGQYLEAYLRSPAGAAGKLLNPHATESCQYCPISTADQFLAGVGMTWETRWRNAGIMWAYIVFNVGMTFVLYYCFRVRKGSLFSLKFLAKGKSVGREAGEEVERNQQGQGLARRKTEIQPRAY